ncbi:hypothetical protein V6N13_136547 [Hibiscus sabdariffa]|uniref:Uncharacterized protein n=1 Tax=Hibiscus sabdariffa TaxID=183260 RepID=A0ABR2DPJ0_9ROSI
MELNHILFHNLPCIAGKKIPDPEFLGPLEVDKLPMDAWGNWCKDGVLCFGVNVDRMMKVYFVDPRNLVVYHVIDFDYMKCELPWKKAGCILSGSKIYILGGYGSLGDTPPIDVYFCNVSTPPEFLDGNYEWHWQKGPSLNSDKNTHEIFSLMGNIYVFSAPKKLDDDADLFEVLKYDRCRWEVLPSPSPLCFPLMLSGFHERKFTFISDKKIVISWNNDDDVFSWENDNDVLMYDAERNEWSTMTMSEKLHGRCGSYFTMHSLHAEETGLFDPSKEGISRLSDFCSQFTRVSLSTAADDEYPNYQFFQIKDKKFCFLALYYEGMKPCARVGTFGLEECDSDEDGSKLLYLKSCYRLTDMKFKDIVLTNNLSNTAFPLECCSYMGTFSYC